MMNHLLSLTIWTPIIFGFLTLVLFGKNDCMARYFSLFGSIVSLIFSILVFHLFNSHDAAMQFEELAVWIPSFNINYHLGVDGISMPFVLLNNLVTVLVVLAGFKVIKHKVSLYYSMFLL